MENPKYLAAISSNTEKWKPLVEEYEKIKFKHPSFSTKCIHEGQKPDAIHGAVNVPIYASTTYAQAYPGKLASKYDYARCGNPTGDCFNQAIAALDYGQYALTFSSGCGGTTAILSSLKAGEHLICSDDVYGGTNRLLNKVLLPHFDYKFDMVDQTNLQDVKDAIIPGKTKMIWCETPTNPTMKVCDIEALAEIAHANDMILVCDNTFATPFLQSPLLLGADICHHSCTKYINGHSDVIAGACTFKSKELHDKIHLIAKTFGVNLGMFETYFMMRGMKTLKVRMEQHCKNGWLISKYLSTHPMVAKVSYPGLESDPYHELAKKQMRGYGGMITFYIKGGLPHAHKFQSSLKIFILAESLGGVESLAESPAIMTHASVPKEHRLSLGIDDTLIRLSCGIEDSEDLLEDISQALDSATNLI